MFRASSTEKGFLFYIVIKHKGALGDQQTPGLD